MYKARDTRLEPATDRPADFAHSPEGRQIAFAASGDGRADSRSIGFFAGNAPQTLAPIRMTAPQLSRSRYCFTKSQPTSAM